MKIEIVEAFYGRPDETAEDFTLYLQGASVEVPDDFARMVIQKGLAKAASPKAKEAPINEAQ